MAKKKLNEVDQVATLKDSEHIMVRMEGGAIGWIKKSDLYPVASKDINGLLSSSIFKTLLYYKGTYTGDLNDLTESGYWMTNSSIANGRFNFGTILVLNTYYILQIQSYAVSSMLAYRTSVDNGKTWNEWKTMS
ncbi:MAG: pyocin knob domain-containing protein [Tannerellaceae bacterium]|nr:pyocin knob domain-containing protein [Tannerellaceae bacterium]